MWPVVITVVVKMQRNRSRAVTVGVASEVEILTSCN